MHFTRLFFHTRSTRLLRPLRFGSVNPSGRLPVTFPASVNVCLTRSSPTPLDSTTPFSRGLFRSALVGYRWYDARSITPQFPFGFGLSYTTFSIANLNVVDNPASGNPTPLLALR